MATLPNPNPLTNNAVANYSYFVDPASTTPSSGANISNDVSTFINVADPQITKTVDKAFANVGDILQYKVVVKNLGNMTADNVVVTDTTPSGTSFITDSITVNNVGQPGKVIDPPTGLDVGSLLPNSVTTIIWNVKVETIPNPNPIPNSATNEYDFLVDPAGPTRDNGANNSNIVNTQVNNANISGDNLVKTATPTTGKVGDIIQYRIVMKNSGNVSANNVVFTDTIPNFTSFQPNSVTVNGVGQSGVSPAPPTGVTIGTIGPLGTVTLTFDVKLTAIPTINPIPNTGKVSYVYTTDPANVNGQSGQALTNVANVYTNQAVIDNTNGGGMVKTVDKAYAKVGDTLEYVINLTNTGNVTADNVVFTDTIPNQTSLIPDSVFINGVNQPGLTPVPPTGVNIGSIAPGATTSVLFKVTVTTIPSPNPIPNDSTVKFTYTQDPLVPNGASGAGNSNRVTTQVNQATIDNTNGGGLVKYTDKTFAKVGDVIQYTIVLKNTGNVAANNVVFTDTIPNDTSFEINSVKLNGVTQSGVSPAPPTGVTVGTINAGSAATIVFDVKVNTIPNPNPIPNNGTVNYNFTIDPSVPNGSSASGNTNQVTTQVNQATIDNTNGGGLVKSVDKAFAKVGDILTYTISLKNTGNVTANNVIVTDTIPNGTAFKVDSVTVNGAGQTGVSPIPPTGVNVGSIAPGATTVMTFQVTVSTIPSPNPIPNNSTVRYNYTIDPAVPNGGSASGNSNQVTTQVNQATIDNTNGGGLVKSVNYSYADVGYLLTYTIALKNTGNVNAENVVLTDTIPNGTTFVADSVKLNGIDQPGENPAPPTGINVGTIAPNTTSTIVYNVTVDTIPSPNPIPNNATVNYQYTTDPAVPGGNSGSGNSNQVTTQVNNANFSNNSNGIVKYVDRTTGKPGDILTYRIVVKNTGNVSANNVVFTDTIPSGTSFNSNTLKLNGVVQSGANPAPPTGFTLGTIGPGVTQTISFEVTIASIPATNPIPNTGKVAYNYTINPSSPNGASGQNLSNTVNTQVNQAVIDNTNGGGLVKAVDKAYAKVGETISYTINLTNTGNVAANNVVFTDTIPNGTSFVVNSVYVNGINQPGETPVPPTGVNVGSIAPGATTSILFQVTVNTIPSPNPIPNTGTVKFTYTEDPALPNGASGSGNSNIVNTQVNSAIIDNNGVNGNGLNKSVDKAYAAVGDTVKYTIVMKNTGNVSANNVVFTDTIPNGANFVNDTFAINGVKQLGANPAPPTGVTIGTLLPNQTVTLSFDAAVNTLPVPNPMQNSSTVKFSYTVNPAIPNGENSGGNSNTVNTQVNGGFNPNNGGLSKTVNQVYGKVGDTLVYDIVIFNNGNTTLGNILVKDTIPSGTTFVNNSVTIDGIGKPGFNPEVGISIGSIPVGITTTIRFNVKVGETIPSPNPIPNKGVMTYTYTVDPANPNGRSDGGFTNTVNTQINSAIFNNNNGSLVKSVSASYADVGDTLTYRIDLKNTGNATANNVVVTDTIPNGTTFIINTATANGVIQAGADPLTGITIISIAPGASGSVTFQVKVDTIPTPNPMPNNAVVNYQYTMDPANPNGASAAGISNTVNTQVNNANFNGGSGQSGITKSVDKAYAKVGDVLTYVVRLQNTGNVSANNVVFKDTIPTGTTFNSNSVYVNGTQQLGANPQAGVTVGSINPSATTTVLFTVTVNTVPSPNPIPNNAFINYAYTTNPSIPNGKSGAALSNDVNTQVNQATIDNTNGGGLVKAVDKAYAKVGDVINYSIYLSNTGNVDATNVLFTDTIPSGTSFVTGSVYVNSVNDPVANPAPGSGIAIANIPSLTSATITFQVTVNTIPTPNPIPNSGTVKYNFTIDPAVPNGGSGSGNSNKVNTQVNFANIDNNGVGGNGLTKTVSPNPAATGDTLTYTIYAKNTGNVAATNVVITDTIPNGTTFVNNSVKVNGTQQVGVNPEAGINIGTLNPSQTATIVFNVTVGVTIPSPNPIPNTANVKYNYTIDPSVPNGGSATGASNVANDTINSAIINNNVGGGLVKYVNKAYAAPNDILNYTIVVGNTGNVTANNVVVSDTIPTGTTFVINSVYVNNVQQPAVNPQNGVSINNIGPGGSATVTFSVQIGATVPSPNPIPNNSRVSFTFTVIPTVPNGRSGGGISNTVNTQVNAPVMNSANGGLLKYASKSYADVGDIINYQIVLKNTGNVAANNVVVTDTIPNGTTFVDNSLIYNNTPQGGAVIAPPTGFSIFAINPNETATIQFNVKVTTIPSPNPIRNAATANFVYTQDPSVPNGASGSGNTNIVPTQINSGGLDPAKGGFTKYVDKQFAKVGDSLKFTSVLKNTGNVSVNNVIFKDTIPSGTTLDSNSITVNNTPVSGNPQNGINVGTIAPQATTTVIFNVVVITIPSPNPIPNTAVTTYSYTVDPSVPNGNSGGNISNTTTTQVNQATIDNSNGGGLVKSVDRSFAKIGDTLNYTIILKNTGNIAANNVNLTDTVPNGTAYADGTARVNGVPVSITSPTNGIPVGIINPGQVATVTFSVTVTTIPSPNPIPNSSTVAYNFIVDTVNQTSANGYGNSNTAITQVNAAIIDNTTGGGFLKTVNKAYADLNDVLVYSIRVRNTGNVTANNVVITDTIPNGTAFVSGSVIINGVPNSSANPQSGVNLGSIAPASTATIIFNVTVTTVPSPNPIPNSGTANYTYTVDPVNPDGTTGGGNTNIVNTQVNNANFNSANGGNTKTTTPQYVKVGDTITYNVKLTNQGTVQATNVIFVDTIPNGTTFVPNSVFVNSSQRLGANPQNGVSLSNIAPGVTTEVQFQVVVNTLPTVNPIPNKSNVTYGYVVDPSFPNGKRASDLSNTVTNQVNDPFINPANGGLRKSANKQYATLGEEIGYTIAVKNTGNVPATSVLLRDTIPSGTAFVPGTVFVDNVNQPGVNPESGVNLPELIPGQSATMTFNVVVTTIPLVNPIPNTGLLSYNFTVDPSLPNSGLSTIPSNTVLTQVNAAIIDNNNGGGLKKTVNYAYADIGYVLTYSVNIKNTGNVTATNVVINDTIPQGTVFVGNSVRLNGVQQPGVNPQAGVNVGTLAPNAQASITFNVTVSTIPSPNPIPNNAISTYSFIVNPINPVPTTVKGSSNIVNTQVNNGNIDFNKGGGFVKSADKTSVVVGDTINYTLKLTNTGNTTVNNVVVTDTVPNGATYIQGTAAVNGVPVSITNPQNGIPVGSIGPLQTSVVTFAVLVTQVPSPNPMVNTATVKYTYTVDPANPNSVNGGGNSNSVTNGLIQAIIDSASGGFSKSVNKQYADVGEAIKYTIVAKNTGTTTANNVVITDTIPNGTSFVNGTVTLNGIPQGSANPATGINIGSLGINQVATITFDINVTQIPNPNPIPNAATTTFTYTKDQTNPDGARGYGNTNITNTQVNHGQISNADGGLVKSVDKTCAGINEVIEYTIVVKNTGNVTVTNVVITDTIPNATAFVPNSVKVNGAIYSGISPQTGINLNSIAPQGVNTITFNVTVVTLPASANTTNTAIARYSYTVVPSVPNGVTASNSSNTVQTSIYSAIIEGSSFNKAVDRAYADLGDILTYTLSLRNSGNTNAFNVTVYDTIPNGTSFVSGSVIVNGASQASANPEAGIPIGVIAPNAVVTIVYNVKVDSLAIPKPNPVPNKADVVYCFNSCNDTTVTTRSSSEIG